MLPAYKSQNIDAALLSVETVESPPKRSLIDNVALGIATGGGIGYIPFISATWGSLLGIGFYLLAIKLSQSFYVWVGDNNFTGSFFESVQDSFTLIFLIALFLLGIWAATRVVKITGEKDPRIVVVDEIVGQLVTFLFVPPNLGWWSVAAGFIVFRIFDIWKPYPANKLESLPTGLGVMADDVMAGFYAAAFMSLLCLIYLVVFF